MDLVGIDVNLAAATGVWEGFDRAPRFRPSPIQAALVASGRLGRKTGEGFYRYDPGGAPARSGRGLRRSASARPTRPRRRAGAIAERIRLAIANEAFRALDERVAADEATIDLALTLGANHPEGPFAWAHDRTPGDRRRRARGARFRRAGCLHARRRAPRSRRQGRSWRGSACDRLAIGLISTGTGRATVPCPSSGSQRDRALRFAGPVHGTALEVDHGSPLHVPSPRRRRHRRGRAPSRRLQLQRDRRPGQRPPPAPRPRRVRVRPVRARARPAGLLAAERRQGPRGAPAGHAVRQDGRQVQLEWRRPSSGADPAFAATLAQLGKSASDVGFAIAEPDPTNAADCAVMIGVFAVNGADGGQLKTVFLAEATSEETVLFGVERWRQGRLHRRERPDRARTTPTSRATASSSSRHPTTRRRAAAPADRAALTRADPRRRAYNRAHEPRSPAPASRPVDRRGRAQPGRPLRRRPRLGPPR